MNEPTVAYDGQENGATHLAKADEVVFAFGEDRDASFAIRDLELLLLDTSKGAER